MMMDEDRPHYENAAKAVLRLQQSGVWSPAEYRAQASDEALARFLCYRYEIEDGFSKEQAQCASESGMWINFLKTAQAIKAEFDVRTK
jgi:hypothetical protein